MGCKSFDVVRFDLGPLLEGQTRIAKPKSAYNSLIIGPRCFQCETTLQEIMGLESFDWLIGFGELSFWWIQFASVLRCDVLGLVIICDLPSIW